MFWHLTIYVRNLSISISFSDKTKLYITLE